MIKNKVKLVLIEWVDSSQPLPNWAHLASLPSAVPIECVSVGWLLHDDKQVKMLAPNMGDMKSGGNEQAMGIINIPTAAVKRVVKLQEYD